MTVYGLVESIFVIYTSPYNAGNERVLKYFQGALFLCFAVREKKNGKVPVYRETCIDFNVSISFLHLVIITITTINVQKAVLK